MLPPEKTCLASFSQLSARKERHQTEGNKQVREGQGYEGVAHQRRRIFACFVNPLLHMCLRACNNSPFIWVCFDWQSDRVMMNSAPPFTPRLFPLRLPRLCVAVIGSDPNELTEKAEALARDNSFLEFRLDYFSKPGLAVPRIKRFLESHPGTVVIATCRRAPNGGKFRGSIASQLDILGKAAAAGCQIVDVELQTAAKSKPGQLQKLRSRAGLILSFHDFRATKKLDESLEKMLAYPADFYKVVSTATTLADNVTMIKFLAREGDRHSMVGMCMGEQGIISRVLGVRAGSVFTFASAGAGQETAPGQVSAQELRSVYRIEQVDVATRVYGVVGDPIAQSLSPAIMNAAFRRENVNAVYLALHAKTLKDLLTCIREIPIHGISVTMPYKEAILAHLDNSDSHTAKIGACNTVVRAQDGKLYGFNTDTAGVVRPIERRLNTIEGARILVIGAGGAARAAVFGLKERGAEVYIMNRSAGRAKKLAHQAHARIMKRQELRKMAFDVIVNATPVGMGNSRETPLQEKEINARYVFDMIYDPAETRLLKLAKERGAQIIPGIEMFVHQAARQFEIWTGKPAPWDEMLRVVLLARQDRANRSSPGK
jgi:3-dehydroquinate dehydratase / shikimate dehydrogenase